MNALAHTHPCNEPECRRDFKCYNPECTTAGGPRTCPSCMFLLRRRHKTSARGYTFL